MLEDFKFKEDDDKIAKSPYLYINKKTVRFGADVYQFRNVTGFGIVRVKKPLVPFKFFWVSLLIGFSFMSSATSPLDYFTFIFFPQLQILSSLGFLRPVLGVLLPIVVYILTCIKQVSYGLKLHVNSGDGKIFVTDNKKFLKDLVYDLYKFMESDEDFNYKINIRQGDIIKQTGTFGVGVNQGQIEEGEF